MMKLRNLMQVACMATAALTAFSCSQEEFENSGRSGKETSPLTQRLKAQVPTPVLP